MAATRCAARRMRRRGLTRRAGQVRLPEMWIPALIPKQEQAHWVVLGISRRHRLEGLAKGVDVTFAGDERGSAGSRVSQVALNLRCKRMCATKHAPRGPCRVLKHRHGLADIVERGVGVQVERLRVNPPRPERGFIILSENASRQRLRNVTPR